MSEVTVKNLGSGVYRIKAEDGFVDVNPIFEFGERCWKVAVIKTNIDDREVRRSLIEAFRDELPVNWTI